MARAQDERRRSAEQEADEQRARPAGEHRGDGQRRPPVAVREDAGHDASDPADADDEEGRERGRGRVIGAGGREARRDEQRHPRPHRVELPHVAEVAEVRELDRPVAERRRRDRHAEARRRGLERTRLREGEHEQATDDRGDRGERDDRPPVEARERAGGAEQMRQCRPDGQRPDQHADRHAAPEAEPSRDHPHPDRVHRRQRHAGQGSPRQGRGGVGGDEREAEIAGRGDERADTEQAPPGKDIGRPGRRDGQGSDRESELDRHGQERQVQSAGMPLVGEERPHGRRAEPRREAEEGPHGEDGQFPPPTGRVGLDGHGGPGRKV